MLLILLKDRKKKVVFVVDSVEFCRGVGNLENFISCSSILASIIYIAVSQIPLLLVSKI